MTIILKRKTFVTIFLSLFSFNCHLYIVCTKCWCFTIPIFLLKLFLCQKVISSTQNNLYQNQLIMYFKAKASFKDVCVAMEVIAIICTVQCLFVTCSQNGSFVIHVNDLKQGACSYSDTNNLRFL